METTPAAVIMLRLKSDGHLYCWSAVLAQDPRFETVSVAKDGKVAPHEPLKLAPEQVIKPVEDPPADITQLLRRQQEAAAQPPAAVIVDEPPPPQAPPPEPPKSPAAPIAPFVADPAKALAAARNRAELLSLARNLGMTRVKANQTADAIREQIRTHIAQPAPAAAQG